MDSESLELAATKHETDSQKAISSTPLVHEALEQEGGFEAWCTVAGGWLALFGTFGYLSSFGVYQELYTQVQTSSFSNISWIGSTQLFLFVAMGLPAGRLLDKGYFRPVVFVGSVIYIFSLFMLSLAHVHKYYQLFLSQGVGVGIGTGLIYLPAVAVQAHHWRKRRALAMGIVITGSSVGGIVYPIMLNNLFNSSVGFAWGVRASAFLTLGVLALANCLMKARPPKKPAFVGPPANVRDVLTDVPFMVGPIIGGFLIVWGLFFPYYYLQVFAVFHRLPTKFAFYTLTIQNGASIFGRTIPNMFADHLGVLNVAIAMTLGTGVVVFALFGITNVGGVVAFAILYGFFSGAVLSLFAPIIASFVRDASELGVRLGLAYFLTSFAYLIGPPIAGALLGNGAVGPGVHWNRPIILSGTVILAAVPLLLVGRILQAKRKRTPYV